MHLTVVPDTPKTDDELRLQGLVDEANRWLSQSDHFDDPRFGVFDLLELVAVSRGVMAQLVQQVVVLSECVAAHRRATRRLAGAVTELALESVRCPCGRQVALEHLAAHLRHPSHDPGGAA